MFPLSKYTSLPIFWSMIFMLWNFLIDWEYLASYPSSYTLKNSTLLSWFLNVVTMNFRISRGARLLLDRKPKLYEVAEHLSTKVEVNPRIISTLKTQNPFEAWIQGGGGWNINGQNSGNYSFLGQETNVIGLFQDRDICWDTLHEYFSFHSS